jgi:hypothetical protein
MLIPKKIVISTKFMLISIFIVGCNCGKGDNEQQPTVEQFTSNDTETELQQLKREEEMLTESLKKYFKTQIWKDDIEVNIIERRGNKEVIRNYITHLTHILAQFNALQIGTIDEKILEKFNNFMNNVEGTTMPLDPYGLVKNQQNIIKAKQITNLTLQLYKNLEKQAELK